VHIQIKIHLVIKEYSNAHSPKGSPEEFIDLNLAISVYLILIGILKFSVNRDACFF